MKKLKRAMQAVGVVALAVLGTACSDDAANRFVSDVRIDFQNYNNEERIIRLEMEFDGDRLSFPGTIVFPIFNKNNPNEDYGRVEFGRTISGNKTYIALDVRVAQIVDANIQSARLPNGNQIPGVLSDSDVYSLELGENTGSFVYLGIGPQLGFLGAAVNIEQFDTFAQNQIQNFNIFPTFRISDDIAGYAGAYFGQDEGTSGLAFFVDLLPLIEKHIENENVTNLRARRNLNEESFNGLNGDQHLLRALSTPVVITKGPGRLERHNQREVRQETPRFVVKQKKRKDYSKDELAIGKKAKKFIERLQDHESQLRPKSYDRNELHKLETLRRNLGRAI